MAPYYETNRRISQPSYRNYQGYATQGSLRVPYINRCSCIPARPCTHGNYGSEISKTNIKTEPIDHHLNSNLFYLEGNHYRSAPPHDWHRRVDANNDDATFGQQGQPIQATPRTSRLDQAPAPRTIRHTVTRYKENMLPFDNRGYRGRAILEGAGTDVYSGPRQAEVEVGQPQAYSQSTSIQRQAKLSSADRERDYLNNTCDNILPLEQRFTTSSLQYHPLYAPSTNYTYPDTMSLSYESRSFMPESSYPNMMHEHQEHEEIQHEHTRYPSPPAPLSENPYNAQNIESSAEDPMEGLANLANHESDIPSPGRSKPIPKPARQITRGENGRYVCTWVDCSEEIRDFGRKCEWSKHMDKHDRPYKCPADGCEKLPGFTYSGGLLRHEREVHGKHGGPKKQLNCPHPNCKRHTGKGFSRQENLNEHLRRVHTDGAPQDGEATEEEEELKQGLKRKRVATGGGRDDVREELKRLRIENDDLRRNLEVQTAQTTKMMQQIAQLQQNQQQAQLQASLQQHARMPQASMLS